MDPLTFIMLAMGIVIIAIIIVISLKIPNPTKSQFWIWRVITSLGAACIGAVIPGFVEIDGSINEIVVRAGGALALFLVVYLLNPPEKMALNKR